ncbi:hypothetical protein CpecG_0671 [Chlamydia pecorum MC/MarsBar]|uniref:hypothetical protein n=1 Tax=Chlamydia pecorum TaxID=85991 RepID=UPI0003D3B890|nr:hypothetical protein [Chlamydia pecorum]ETF37986.1 hypothetical protein CpecF_0672 [Chlamydia pecorum DBDeUG]ETF38254.1 hypothetical protein CpecG_0671 [Chlamydia pecorum MC/MarsBar]ETF40220.1 hypothetical protein CpecA_0670 [Chlamydia pecorum IPTaLE]UBV32239.1 hypothetical protein MarsBar_0680 [Chlamydia pecorum]UBV33186.1 hypothetical protein DBDeUG_0681 [Chlamydia pecorum]
MVSPSSSQILSASYVQIISPQEVLPCSPKQSKGSVVTLVKFFLGIICALLALSSYLTLSGQCILILPQHCAMIAIGLAIALVLFGITYLNCLMEDKESSPQEKWVVMTLLPKPQFPEDQQEIQSSLKAAECSEPVFSDEPPSYQSIMETKS